MIALYDLRCPRCGSYAYDAEEVAPLPGSVTVGPELRIECRDCGLTVTNAPERARESFTGHQRSDEITALLDRRSLYYCGLVVEGKSQRDPEAHRGAPTMPLVPPALPWFLDRLLTGPPPLPPNTRVPGAVLRPPRGRKGR